MRHWNAQSILSWENAEGGHEGQQHMLPPFVLYLITTRSRLVFCVQVCVCFCFRLVDSAFAGQGVSVPEVLYSLRLVVGNS